MEGRDDKHCLRKVSRAVAVWQRLSLAARTKAVWGSAEGTTVVGPGNPQAMRASRKESPLQGEAFLEGSPLGRTGLLFNLAAHPDPV